MKHGFSSREADDVANLTFIGGRTNRKISDKPPSIYLADYLEKQGADLLALQGIPADSELLEVEKFRAFLEARRVLLSEAINQFLNVVNE